MQLINCLGACDKKNTDTEFINRENPTILNFLMRVFPFASPTLSSPPPSYHNHRQKPPGTDVSQVGEKGTRMDGLEIVSALSGSSHFQNMRSSPVKDNGNGYDHEEGERQREDLWGLEWSMSHMVGDDIFVEDLLNLGGIQEEVFDQQQQPLLAEKLGGGGKKEDEQKIDEDEDRRSTNSSSNLSYDHVNPSEPIIPVGGIYDLEWVSQIVDDSFMDIPCSGISPAYLPLSNTVTNNHSRSPSDGSATSVSTSLKRTIVCFSDKPLVVPSKPRSKRSRTGRSVWSFRHPFLIEPISASSVSSSSSSTSSAFVLESKPINPEDVAVFSPVVFPRGRGRPPLHKKKNPLSADQQLKKKKGRKSKVTTTTTTTTPAAAAAELSVLEAGANGRRCSHCGVQKTPQWRAGPMGSKTLCNACGVRYKSGRLLPEYRPAISPTFLDHVHSNSHRKVLEMRRKKEVQVQFKQQPLESSSPPCHLPAAQATSQPPIVF